MIISMFMSRQKRDCWSLMLWSRKVRQLTISFRDLARSKLWDGRRVDSVTGQSAPGVHSHNANSCPSKTFIHGRRNSNVSTWIKLSARFKTFLNHGRLCMWTRVENGGRGLLVRITVIQCSSVRDLDSLRFPTKKRSHFPLVCMKFVARIGSHPQHLISDKACEINSKSSIHCCWQKAVNTSVFQKASITV